MYTAGSSIQENRFLRLLIISTDLKVLLYLDIDRGCFDVFDEYLEEALLPLCNHGKYSEY